MTNATNLAPDDNTSLDGKDVLLTGATNGLGEVLAEKFLADGARLIFTYRDPELGKAKLAELRSTYGNLSVDALHVDLANPDSVNDFNYRILDHFDKLDLLVANAGIAMVGDQTLLYGGKVEKTIAVNSFSHFLIVEALKGKLAESPHSRVTFVGSNVAKTADFAIIKEMLELEKFVFESGKYSPDQAYGISKVMNMMYCSVLNSQGFESTIGDPGNSKSNILTSNDTTAFWWKILGTITKPIAQSTEKGAEYIYIAATDPTLEGGEYVAPTGMGNMSGAAGVVEVKNKNRIELLADRYNEVATYLANQLRG